LNEKTPPRVAADLIAGVVAQRRWFLAAIVFKISNPTPLAT